MTRKRKLDEISASFSPDDVNGRGAHLEARALNELKREEPLRFGRDPRLDLYIWQNPHSPREVESDGEDDEWRGSPGSLLGSDILARLYRTSNFVSDAQESRQEQGIVSANKPERVKLNIREIRQALARTYKYGQRPTTTKKTHSPSYSTWSHRFTKELASQYSTDHYTKFDPNTPYHMQAVAAERLNPSCSFYNYKGYHLCMDPKITNASDIPQLPVRLDDRLVALVYEKFAAKDRQRLWPSEFDVNGMVRPGRIPLGFAAKHEYRVGDVDFHGNVLQPGEEGWYYLWLAGIHCLMGKEGMDAGRFEPRHSSNRLRIIGFAFRKCHRAEIQAPPGADSEM